MKMTKTSLQLFFAPFKQGVDLITQSFRLLFTHPTLFSYYAALILAQSIIFVLIVNLIGHRLPLFEMSHELHLSMNVENAPTFNGNVLFLYLLGSIAWSIFLRSFASVALIEHAHRLLNGQQPSVKQAIKDTYAKRKKVSIWALLLTAITTGAQLLALLSPHKITLIFILLALIAWGILSCFVLVSIALEQTSLKQSFISSIDCVTKYFRQILGCISWIAILYLLALAIISLFGSLVPKPAFIPLSYALLFGLNGIVSQALLIFKTKLYDRYLLNKTELFKDESSIDYSQF